MYREKYPRAYSAEDALKHLFRNKEAMEVEKIIGMISYARKNKMVKGQLRKLHHAVVASEQNVDTKSQFCRYLEDWFQSLFHARLSERRNE
uniref:Uncharacterized protein n=1 Tax=Peronospora matthiolae TaxID=2874970 RepID=A0AAV1TPI3_9STRA